MASSLDVNKNNADECLQRLDALLNNTTSENLADEVRKLLTYITKCITQDEIRWDYNNVTRYEVDLLSDISG